MNQKEKNFIQNILLIFILLHPFLDIAATYVRIGPISLSTIIRPLIPFLLISFILIKEKKFRKQILPLLIFYVLYCVLHLWTYHSYKSGFAFGSVFYEAQYLLNYGYLIFLFLLYRNVFTEDTKKLRIALLYMVLEILFLLFLSIVTNTSTSTYLEGIGEKGWFSSGGMLGSTLTISLWILIAYMKDFTKKQKVLFFIAGIFMLLYLCFYLGTRVALYGALLTILVSGYFALILLLCKKKQYVMSALMTIVLFIIGVFILNWKTERNRYLEDLKDDIRDPDTGEVIHIAYDILKVKKEVEQGVATNLNENQKKAIINLYDFAEKHQLNSVDMRTQQFLYHTYLYQAEGFSIPQKLFGNGYLSNMGALTLEMEEIALWYNFGIIGFFLFFGIFLYEALRGVIVGIKYRSKIDFSYLMLTCGCFYSFAIALFSGHTFFHTSVMIVIVILFVTYHKKLEEMSRDEK